MNTVSCNLVYSLMKKVDCKYYIIDSLSYEISLTRNTKQVLVCHKVVVMLKQNTYNYYDIRSKTLDCKCRASYESTTTHRYNTGIKVRYLFNYL